MRHRNRLNKLSLKPSHRNAMIKNMVISLFDHERITTTKAKAKVVRKFAEKMITRGKVDSVHNRREIAKKINNKDILNKLFTVISPRFAERKGGYTRILKLGFRQGDAAEMVILELVEKTEKVEKKDDKKPSAKAKVAPAKAVAKKAVVATPKVSEEAPEVKEKAPEVEEAVVEEVSSEK